MFDTSGLLGPEAEAWSEENLKTHSKWFSLAASTAELAYDVVRKIEVNERDLRGIIVSALLVRMIANFQAIELLLRKGMISQAEVLARTLLETGISLAYADESFENTKRFYDSSVARSVLDLRNLLAFSIRKGKQEDIRRTKEILSHYERSVEEYGAQQISFKKMAKSVGRLDTYEVTYARLCHAAHTRAEELMRRHLRVAENGLFRFKKFGPEDEGLMTVFLSSIEDMFLVMDIVTKRFELGFKERIAELSDQFRAEAENI